jgi:hypothetical protein
MDPVVPPGTGKKGASSMAFGIRKGDQKGHELAS